MVAPDAAFDVVSAVWRQGEFEFAADFPDGWQQGRGLFGGLVTATLVRALEAAAGGRVLRSLNSELCGPVQPGLARLRVEALRVGSGMSTLAVRLEQGGGVLAHGVGVLGAARANLVERVELARPTLGDWHTEPVVPVAPPLGPDFARFYEYRTATLPFAGGRPEVEGWVRPNVPGATRDAAYLAGCIDAFWPTEFMVLEMPRPMATVAFTFQPFGDFEGLDPEPPLFFRARLAAARGGYGVEFRELWGHDGRLLALNQQTLCTIR